MPILGQPYSSSCKGMNCSSSPRPCPAGLVNNLVHDGLEFPLNPKNMVLPKKKNQKSSICTTPSCRQDNVGGEQNKYGYKTKKLHLLTQQMNSDHPPRVPNNKPHPNTLPLTQSPHSESIFMTHEQKKLMKIVWKLHFTIKMWLLLAS